MPQMQELVNRVHDALPGPWNKKVGRPKRCGLYDAVETTCMYIRHNATQEFLGDLRDTSQSTVSRMVSTLPPLVKAVLEVRARRGRGHRDGQRPGVPDRRDHHPLLVLR